jgi:hypothetical protein
MAGVLGTREFIILGIMGGGLIAVGAFVWVLVLHDRRSTSDRNREVGEEDDL